MKKQLLASVLSDPQPAFISTWDTRNTSTGSSPSDTVTLPLTQDLALTIDWGDGAVESISTISQATHV